MGIFQVAVLNDIHFPYEGKSYYKALELMRKFPELRHIYLNGDVAEIESVSTHPKGPKAEKVLLEELDYTNQKFDQLQKMFNVPVEVSEGNHCYRVFRFIRDVAPQMWGLLNMPDLFKFKDRPKWKWHPYGPSQWVKCSTAKDLWLRHEPLAGGVNHARGTAEKAYVSVLYGHTHQYQIATQKKAGPNPYLVTAMSCGWLGDISKSCFDYRGAKDNWVNGFTRIDVDEKTGEYELRFIYL